MSIPAALSLPTTVVQTLSLVADALKGARDPWWLIGGAAIGLQGIPSTSIPDIDVVTSARDALQVLQALDIPPGEDGGTALFRSEVFGRWTTTAPLPVEFLGGFHIRTQEGWTPVEPATCDAFLVDGKTVYVPSRQELIEICRMFGRTKDLVRAEALARLEQPQPEA